MTSVKMIFENTLGVGSKHLRGWEYGRVKPIEVRYMVNKTDGSVTISKEKNTSEPPQALKCILCMKSLLGNMWKQNLILSLIVYA